MKRRSSVSHDRDLRARSRADAPPLLDRESLFDSARTSGRASGENFPVAAFFLPRQWRAHLMAVYGFARLVDDIGDEAVGDRSALLDELEADLKRAPSGHAAIRQVQEVGRTVTALDLPLQPFYDLIEANRHDQVVTRYERYEDLLAYCRLSAAPVGRIVLAVMGEADAVNLALSDDVCTGLQLAEHIQDVGEDYRRGRVYLPTEDLEACACVPHLLGGATATAPVRRAVSLMTDRARLLLDSGRVLSRRLRPLARLAIAGYTAGGLAALDAVVANDYDVLASDCLPSRHRVVLRALSVAFGPNPRRRAA